MYLSKIDQLYDFDFLLNPEILMGFASGIGTTLSVAFFGVLIGIFLGVFLAIGKLLGNKPVKALCTIYINFVRGTPLLIQLYMIYYIPDFILNAYGLGTLGLNGYVVGIVAVGLNSAAYVAEIFRGGILSVDKGQFEAASSLGFDYKKTLRLIILPQALKNILPTLGNEFIVVIKETAIISVIATKDLMFYANQIRSTTGNPFAALIFAALIYFIIIYVLSKLVKMWEEKLQND